MRSASDKLCRQNQNTHFMLSNFFHENRAVYEIMWTNIVQPDRPQMTIRRMRIACWIPKATNTHSQYVILTDSPLQQRLHKLPSMLRYTYIASLVHYVLNFTLPSCRPNFSQVARTTKKGSVGQFWGNLLMNKNKIT